MARNNNISQELLAKLQDAQKSCAPRTPSREFFGFFVGCGEASFASNDGQQYTRPAVKLMNVKTEKVFPVIVPQFVVDQVNGLDEESLELGDQLRITQITVGERVLDDGRKVNEYRYKVVNSTTSEVIIEYRPKQ